MHYCVFYTWMQKFIILPFHEWICQCWTSFRPNVFQVSIHNLLFGQNGRLPEPLSDNESIRINKVQHCADSGLSVCACLFSVRCTTSAAQRRVRTAPRDVPWQMVCVWPLEDPPVGSMGNVWANGAPSAVIAILDIADTSVTKPFLSGHLKKTVCWGTSWEVEEVHAKPKLTSCWEPASPRAACSAWPHVTPTSSLFWKWVIHMMCIYFKPPLGDQIRFKAITLCCLFVSQIVDGYLTVRANLGDGAHSLKLTGHRVNHGQWVFVSLHRHDNIFTLRLEQGGGSREVTGVLGLKKEIVVHPSSVFLGNSATPNTQGDFQGGFSLPFFPHCCNSNQRVA